MGGGIAGPLPEEAGAKEEMTEEEEEQENAKKLHSHQVFFSGLARHEYVSLFIDCSPLLMEDMKCPRRTISCPLVLLNLCLPSVCSVPFHFFIVALTEEEMNSSSQAGLLCGRDTLVAAFSNSFDSNGVQGRTVGATPQEISPKLVWPQMRALEVL